MFRWTSIETPVDQVLCKEFFGLLLGWLHQCGLDIYIDDLNQWLCLVWDFWLLQQCSWDIVSSGLKCHVTGWLVLKVSRQLCCLSNVRHQSHNDMPPYPRKTKTLTLFYFLEGLKHVDISREWSELGGGWSNIEHCNSYPVQATGGWIFMNTSPLLKLLGYLFFGSALQFCCTMMVKSLSWLTAYWFLWWIMCLELPVFNHATPCLFALSCPLCCTSCVWWCLLNAAMWSTCDLLQLLALLWTAFTWMIYV